MRKITNIFSVDPNEFIKFTNDKPFNDLRYSMDSNKI